MSKMTECLFCDGTGEVEEYPYRETVVHECHECDGTGEMSVAQYGEAYQAQQAMRAALLDADVNW